MQNWQFLLLLLVILAFILPRKYWHFSFETRKIDPIEEERALLRKYLTHKKDLMSKTERKFFAELKEHLKDTECLIFTQVRLADIVDVRPQRSRDEYGERNGVFNRVKSKHIDFVITDARGKILQCIELDDRSHESEESQKRDRTKDLALEVTDTPLLRFRAGTTPDFSMIQIEA